MEIVGELESLRGSDRNALAINGARCSLWESRATIGCMPRCMALSAVTFLWKWILAARDGYRVGDVSKTATEVSSLHRKSGSDLRDWAEIAIP